MLPSKLYHGTGFNDLVLKPGYEHTGKEIKWDETESNRYLYATADSGFWFVSIRVDHVSDTKAHWVGRTLP